MSILFASCKAPPGHLRLRLSTARRGVFSFARCTVLLWSPSSRTAAIAALSNRYPLGRAFLNVCRCFDMPMSFGILSFWCLMSAFPEHLLPFLAFHIAGDLADFTIYTTRSGKVVWYPRSPPTKPPTALQLVQRARFGRAVRLFKALPLATRRQWETLAKRNSLCASGINVFISLSLNKDDNALSTLNRTAGLSLSAPEVVP